MGKGSFNPDSNNDFKTSFEIKPVINAHQLNELFTISGKISPDISSVEKQESDTSSTRSRGCPTHGFTFWKFGAMLCCFYANMVSGGLISSYGILYTYMLQTLDVSIYQLTWVGSIMAGFHGVTALVATVLMDMYGCRVVVLMGAVLGSTGIICSSLTNSVYLLYLTLGVLPGIGCCLSYNASMVHLSRTFSRWRPLATGLSVAGAAVGMLSYPPLTSLLTEMFGWKGALMLIGAKFLHLVPCSLLVSYRSKKPEAEQQMKQSLIHKAKQYLKVLYSLPVLLIALAHLFIGFSNPTFTTFLPEYVITGNLGLTAMDSALILSLAGFGSLFSRILFGAVASSHAKAPQIIYAFGLMICGLTEVLIVVNRTSLQFFCNGAVYGLAYGAWPSVGSVMMVNFFGLENLSKTFGVFTFCQGMGSICGPPLQSMLGSLVRNQDVIFVAGGASYMMASLTVVLVICLLSPFEWSRKSITFTPEVIQNKSPSKTKSATIQPEGIWNKSFIADPS